LDNSSNTVNQDLSYRIKKIGDDTVGWMNLNELSSRSYFPSSEGKGRRGEKHS